MFIHFFFPLDLGAIPQHYLSHHRTVTAVPCQHVVEKLAKRRVKMLQAQFLNFFLLCRRPPFANFVTMYRSFVHVTPTHVTYLITLTKIMIVSYT